MANTKQTEETPFIETLTISFPGNPAKAIIVTVKATGKEMNKGLGLPDFPSLILMMGGAEQVEKGLLPSLTKLFNMGIAPAVLSTQSVVVDGGTQAGMMQLMGESLSGRDHRGILIGVAPVALVSYPGGPEGKIPLEPNHTHFVLTAGNQWGDETPYLFEFAEALLQRERKTAAPARYPWNKKKGDSTKVKGVGLLVGGGKGTKKELALAVRAGISVIVVTGSGGLADEVIAALYDKSAVPGDPVLAEIIANGVLYCHSLSKPDKELERLIIRELGMESVLLRAWEKFADYDYNAKRQQNYHTWIQLAIVFLGIISAAAAVYWKTSGFELEQKQKNWQGPALFWHTVLLLCPIILTILLAAVNKFKPGMKWLFLRSGAESLKGEIYAYRTRTGGYAENAEQKLAQRMTIITERTMRTEVNQGAIKPYNSTRGFPPEMYAASDKDDGFSLLGPDRYITFRLGDQLRYYRSSAVRIESKINILYWASFIIAGGATFLTVTEHQVWIAVTTSVVAGIGTYLGYTQLEASLVKYNQGETDLGNVKAWWEALSAEDQLLQTNFDDLVTHTEQILKNEFDGWIQQMETSLNKLDRDKGKKDAQGDKGKPGVEGKKDVQDKN